MRGRGSEPSSVISAGQKSATESNQNCTAKSRECKDQVITAQQLLLDIHSSQYAGIIHTPVQS